jgi:hypothetical protein
MYVLDDLEGWWLAMTEELSANRFRPTGESRNDLLSFNTEFDSWTQSWIERGGSAVRIHDAGDFFNDEYTNAWLKIASVVPDVLFYAYTKEVSRFQRIVAGRAPVNFRWLYSYGGKEDHLIDPERDRHADVFPTMRDLLNAGYFDQSSSDLLAVFAPTNRIGIVTNNIPQLRRRQGEVSFREKQSVRRNSEPQ